MIREILLLIVFLKNLHLIAEMEENFPQYCFDLEDDESQEVYKIAKEFDL